MISPRNVAAANDRVSEFQRMELLDVLFGAVRAAQPHIAFGRLCVVTHAMLWKGVSP